MNQYSGRIHSFVQLFIYMYAVIRRLILSHLARYNLQFSVAFTHSSWCVWIIAIIFLPVCQSSDCSKFAPSVTEQLDSPPVSWNIWILWWNILYDKLCAGFLLRSELHSKSPYADKYLKDRHCSHIPQTAPGFRIESAWSVITALCGPWRYACRHRASANHPEPKSLGGHILGAPILVEKHFPDNNTLSLYSN